MGRERLDYIDGLRGVAVGMVVLYHAFPHEFDLGDGSRNVGLGPAGVSLFFVLSGFCLSYKPLLRREARNTQWFSWRSFARGRIRRILPPYYAALALVLFFDLWLAHVGWPGAWDGVTHITGSDVLAHVLLVQNGATAWYGSIDAPMWSLATEWQWYAVFPLVLASCIRAPRISLGVAFAAALVWSHLSPGYAPWHGTAFVPGRLFEFSCGVIAARAMVEGWRVPRFVGLGCLMLIPVVLWPSQLYDANLVYPLCGAGFSAFLLRCGTWQRSALSFRPLVSLGTVSYAVYLIHYPAMTTALGIGQIVGWPDAVTGCVALCAAAMVSVPFYVLFDRPWTPRAHSVVSTAMPRTETKALNA